MKSILFVDDELKLLKILRSSMEKKGYVVHTTPHPEETRNILSEFPIDVVFLDLMMPGMTGLELLQELTPLYPNKAFIVMTAYGNIESAVSAMKAGAFDYIVKPTKLDELFLVTERAFEWLGMKSENEFLKEKLKQAGTPADSIIGVSPAMKSIMHLVERVAPTDASVLLTGESGTGKTKVAKIIHQWSDRSHRPFIAVNCAAIPEQLLESELFGYEKGAFTGAHAQRKGKFEAADGGTIFLDEIGEISASLQAKLLQVTQEKQFMRLGSNEPVKVDTRIIAATNRNLKKMVQEGSFREDLYYRLNIVDIYIPPLRERKEDIPLLIEEFLNRHRQRYNRQFEISRELLQILMEYDWPGNVRELENAIERAVILCRGDKLSIEDFPEKIRNPKRRKEAQEPVVFDSRQTLYEQLEEIEKRFILNALEETGGNASQAAKKLGISRQNLLYKMNKYAVHFQKS
ncbi:MAG TPA: sigma-54 dependent transcriptional regulator [Paenibacillaceae bacterium]|jgi:DNA-binding NtrC family response regulator